MDILREFERLLWVYDNAHAKRSAQNPRVYRNPYAPMHYQEAISRARDMVKDGTDPLMALCACFESGFTPLKQLKKKCGVL